MIMSEVIAKLLIAQRLTAQALEALQIGESGGSGDGFGPELVTNGSGLTDTAGWSGTTSIALSASNGNLRITRGDNLNQYGYQSVPVVSGKTYRAAFDFIGDSGNSNEYLDFRLGSTQGGLDYGRINVIDDPANVGAHEIFFTATGATAFLNFYLRNGASGDWIEVGNISLREQLTP